MHVPVVNLTFADIKQKSFAGTYALICAKLYRMFEQNSYILKGRQLSEDQKADFQSLKQSLKLENEQGKMNVSTKLETALQSLSYFLFLYYRKKVLIFLDEYDTPMQEVYMNGYWEDNNVMLC